MTKTLPADFNDLWSGDRALQNKAFHHLVEITSSPVGWAYEAWEGLLENLSHEDNHNRAIAAQILCNLAKSDPESRILKDFNALFAVTRDPRFVTARHCLQSLWKVGAAGKEQQTLLVSALEGRFKECIAEKNCTLIRYDILESLRKLYDAVRDEEFRATALAWIETEEDLKYRKKYATLWRAR